ncbi:MAG: DNA internalization-related competence protein ComEC/Rec2 [Gammaproteobacteria bacterium]|nr:DNA internalization-related competence protein ComEC/Rec2 [Gammaproteobacteria bacterium]MBU1490912.1 DNA internalization-related competence protein ComEC/Rec2 [Gammaproteobacteria bacterium]MBU2065473.1 DNA internalization-related competence protein ComEC/Rec2 [Gammaproteobacteria bacterium]MBU2138409.1 DNA internalization-related competence protein ComEC/Rec2 [Gammaproteobacteria bacterium]MBU2216929.1 DNA internalization-related competence protein ComEC/Rec2 [Gammaproteobacteria bacterium
MRAAILALVIGMLLIRWLPALPASPWLWGLGLGGLALLPLRLYPLGCLLLGFTWACLSAQMALDDRLSADLDGRTLWLQGRVVGLPDAREGVVRFEVADAESRRATLPSLIRVAWYDGPLVRAGETWRLAVRLRQPQGGVNPQSFDYEAWLLAQRIGATGTVKSGQRLAAADGASTWRDQLRARLLAVDAFGREGALAALVLGDGSGLSTADWRVLQDTGTVHLLVISGQHIGLLAGLLYGLVAGLARWGLWPRALPWLPCACLLALIGALTYGALAGFEVPVQRACVMVGLTLLWRWRFRHLGVTLPLLLALLVVLSLEPLAVLQPGFWLSFGAVALLVLIFSGRLGAWRWWQSLGRAQWAMALGLLPLMVALGLPVSLSGPLANLLAVPWVGLLVVPLALLGTLLLPIPGVGESILWLAGGLLALLFHGLTLLAAAVPSWLSVDLPVMAWLALVLGVLMLLLPGGVPLRGLGLALILPLAFWPVSKPPVGQAEVWVLDVGQGLAVLVRTREHALLYDAGPRFGEFDTGERIVLPSLRQLGVRHLDRLLISHADNDHAGGAVAVAHGLRVGDVVSGEPQKLPAELAARPCDTMAWLWDQVQFRTWRWAAAGDGNQASCVVLVEAGGERIWLTGDIDVAAEQALLDSGLPLAARWLLAPHHGSRTSSSPVLLDAVQPLVVLVSRGRHNAFGHPHPEVLERFRVRGISVQDTALQGAIRVDLGTFGAAQGWREQRRFWREK